MKRGFIIGSLCLSLAIMESAASSCNENLCEETASSADFSRCAEQSKNEADKNLNDSYTLLLSRVARQYNDSDLGKDYVKKIRSSQRLWIRLRNENCKLKTFEVDSGSWADAVITDLCIVEMSNSRVIFLKSIFPDNIIDYLNLFK